MRLSPSGGQGLFATRGIPLGTRVIQMRGEVLHRDQVDWSRHWSMQVDRDRYLCNDESHTGVDHFLNHCCEPNLGFVNGGMPRHEPWLVALREIHSGEELSWDYSTSMGERGWAMECRCGCDTCRRRIVGFWDLDDATRARLAPNALAYLVDRPLLGRE